MTTAAGRTPRRRRGARSGSPRRRWIALLALVAAGCRVDGAAVIAPYRSPPPAQVTAHAVTGRAGLLALSPDGALAAFADARRGVCFQPITAAGPAVCAGIAPTGTAVSAVFSADGRWVAVGEDVSAQGRGLVWLVDPRTGSARPVPTVAGRPAVASSPPPPAPASSASPTPTPTGVSSDTQGAAAYTALVWGAAGDLLLISSSLDPDGLRSRLVDIDPVSLVPRIVAEATGPYEFQSGYLATGGSTVLFTVYRGDQLLPNLVDIDLASGVRREVGPIGPAGTQLVPLAVSPDGRVAVVGSKTLIHPGPPRLLDVASGRLTDVPGLTGDFGTAAFSPDGARVAVVSTAPDGALTLALALPDASSTARTLGTAAGPLPRGGRLNWSRFDVLSLSGTAATGSAPPGGWRLSG